MSRRNRKKARRQAARQAKRTAKKTIQRIRKTAPAKRTSGQTRRLDAAKQARTTANRRLENNRNRQTTVPSTQSGPSAVTGSPDSGTRNTNIRKQDFGNKLNVSEVRSLMNQGVSNNRIKNIAEKRNISIGGKAQSLIDRSSRNNVPQIGSKKFQNLSLEQQAEIVKGNKDLRSSEEGKAVLSQSRGQFGEDGEYNYGIRFGKGDIKRMKESGMSPAEIKSYINQKDIDNKVSQRYLGKGLDTNESVQATDELTTPDPSPDPTPTPEPTPDPTPDTTGLGDFGLLNFIKADLRLAIRAALSDACRSPTINSAPRIKSSVV